MHRTSVEEFGARGDGTTLATSAIQRAIDDAANRGGGVVVFNSGRYLTGALTLRSDVSLFLDSDATLLGSQNPDDYPLLLTRWEGTEHLAHQPLIFADRAERIALEGSGTIDGQGSPWWKAHRARTLAHPRPRLIGLQWCREVRIDGLNLIDSPAWTVHPYACNRVNVTNVSILSPADSPNTDGIDPESCEDVTISNCHISVGDDCVAIKSGLESSRPLVPCRRVKISGCRMEDGHGAIVLGSEMSGGISDVSVADCTFTGTDRGFRFKTRRGRGGVIQDLRAEEVSMHRVGVPFAINMFYKFTGPNGTNTEVQDRNARPVNDGTPAIRNVSFSRISATETSCAACFALGLPESPIQSLSFRDVSVAMASRAKTFEPEMAVGIEEVSRAGFICTNVSGLSLERVSIANQVGKDFVFENVAVVR